MTTLQLVVQGTGSGVPPGQMLSAWMGLLNNSKAEMIGSVLQSVSVMLSQTDEHYATATHPHTTPFAVDSPITGKCGCMQMHIDLCVALIFLSSASRSTEFLT